MGTREAAVAARHSPSTSLSPGPRQRQAPPRPLSTPTVGPLRLQQGAIVANRRLSAVLAQIQTGQQERDRQRLAGRNLTLRQKDRIQVAREGADAAAPS